MSDKRERQTQIVELIRRNRIDSQDQLVDLMEAEGISSTQSTLSRDLRELGVTKGAEGYRLPDPRDERRGTLHGLASRVRGSFESVDLGGNIVVLRCTRADGAVSVAAEIDRDRPHHVVGAVAVGAMVVVIARGAGYAQDVARALRRA